MITKSWRYPVLNDNDPDVSVTEETSKADGQEEVITFYKAAIPGVKYYAGKNVSGPFIGFGTTQQEAMISVLNNLASAVKG